MTVFGEDIGDVRVILKAEIVDGDAVLGLKRRVDDMIEDALQEKISPAEG